MFRDQAAGGPEVLAGPYWVLDYDEAEGYALISGPAEWDWALLGFVCLQKKTNTEDLQ